MDPVALSKIALPEMISRGEQTRAGGASSFANMLGEALERVKQLGDEADQEVKRLMAGEPVELHRVIMAGQQAGLAFELMMSVRGKVVEAYREVMRMQV